MRKPKKPARRQQAQWEIYRLKGSPAAFVGLVYADSSAAGIKEHNTRKADWDRLIARPR